VGGESGIKYKDIYDEYLNYLHAGIANKRRSVKRLMEFWNDELVGDHPHDSVELPDDVRHAREALADDVDSDSNDNDSGGHTEGEPRPEGSDGNGDNE
jgi:hypothetical protein